MLRSLKRHIKEFMVDCYVLLAARIATLARTATLVRIATHMGVRIMLFAALTLLIAGCGRNSVESSISSEAPPGSRSLVLLFTGDMHSNLESYPQLAELVERERAMAAERGVPLLLLSTGDAPMGTIYHTLFTTNAADYRALSLLGYDATALGNHDFDFGPRALLRSLAAADSLAALSLPLLCANIQIEGDTSGRVAKYIIIQRDSLRILVTATMGIDAIRSISDADSLNYTPADAALAALLPQLPDCHFRILLSHGGTSWVGNEQVTEETPSALRRRRKTEDALLAAKVPLFDAILSGHDHAPLFTPLIVGKTVLGNILEEWSLQRTPLAAPTWWTIGLSQSLHQPPARLLTLHLSLLPNLHPSLLPNLLLSLLCGLQSILRTSLLRCGLHHLLRSAIGK